MSAKAAYREKLKDPRWQKKRLQILERDEWCCQNCGDSGNTLHVHHLRYCDGEPWETPPRWLVTLCSDCHQGETEMLPVALKRWCDAAKFWFWADDIEIIAAALEHAQLDRNMAHPALVGFLSSPDLIEAAIDRFLHGVNETRADYGEGGGHA